MSEELTTDQLFDRLKEANSLLRSAMSIAKREGKETNWQAFRMKLEGELEQEHKIMYPKTELFLNG